MKKLISFILAMLIVLCVAYNTVAYATDIKDVLMYNLNSGKPQYPFTKKYEELTPMLYLSILVRVQDEVLIETYFEYFDSVWGDLVESEGELIYDTLTYGQREQVHFPELNINEVWFVQDSNTYHATSMCYTLARSDEIHSSSLVDAVINGHIDPCSKCVDY